MIRLPTPTGGSYHLIENIDDLEALAEYLLSDDVPIIWFDLETTGLNWKSDEILCLSFSGTIGEGFVVPIFHNPGDGEPDIYPGWANVSFKRVVDILRRIFGSSKDKGGHNVLFDTRMLERDGAAKHILAASAWGIKVNGVLRDTELLNHAIEESLPHNMTSLIGRWTDMPYYEHDIKPYKKEMHKAPNMVLWSYSAADADALPRLWEPMRLVADAEEVTFVLDGITAPMLRVCRAIEDRGFPIDVDMFTRLNAFYEMEIAKEEAKLWQAVPTRAPGWKYNYAATLRKVLFTELGLPQTQRKTPSARGCADCEDGVCFEHDSTGKDNLKEMIDTGCTHPVLPILITLKFLTKRHSTYLAGGKGGFKRYISPDFRVHPSMKISRAETGRLASEQPNCQNIPNYVHIHPVGATCEDTSCKAFYPETFGLNTTNAFHDMVRAPQGYGIMNVDWSQLEIWVLAYTLFEEFGNRSLLDVLESGVDIHLWMARSMYPEVDPDDEDHVWRKNHPDLRRRAKTANFGIGYGLTAQGFVLREGCTMEEAEDTIKRFKAIVPVDMYFKLIRDRLFRDRYVKNAFGRRRHIKHLNILKAMGETRDLEGAIREGINMPIQGGGSDLHSYVSALVRADSRLISRDCNVMLSVHDSLTFEFGWPNDQYARETAWVVKEIFTDAAWNMLRPDGTPLHWRVPCEVEWGETWGTPTHKIDANGTYTVDVDYNEDEETYNRAHGGKPALVLV